MPLIKKPEPAAAKQQVRMRLSESLIKEIEDYCKWAELPSQDYFIEQVALMALDKDKEWNNHRSSKIE
ncbi:hypothetical protein BH10PSE19_BH10PSE19_04660 [soil metagenome]